MKLRGRVTWGYVAVLAGAFVAAVLIGWLPLAAAIDGDAYDWLFRLHRHASGPAPAVVLAIDEQTLAATGGMRNLRATLAETLDRIGPLSPPVVAIDLTLADEGDAAEDARLEAALSKTPHVVLAADIVPGAGEWEEPIARFAKHAAGVGHVHAEDEKVARALPLEKAAGRSRHWALALEALRVARGESITESPGELEVGQLVVPGERREARPLYIRYRDLPVISVLRVLNDPKSLDEIHGRAVFIGVTALSAAQDRLMTPMSVTMGGVIIHANAYATLAGGDIFRNARGGVVVLTCLLLVAAAGAAFALLSGWPAYVAGGAVVLLSHAIPHLAFLNGIVFAYAAPAIAAWLAVGSAAGWQYFVVRRQLRKSESDKARYQQAIHFVTHEMRSPLTAIQGSSEMMGRYNLNEEKRKQIAEMINSESKRLARMIQTFLDIERLTEGEMELKAEKFALGRLLDTCIGRARVLAERKQITIEPGDVEDVTISGDRELMEYALYNLLTNAVKYSPANTRVRVEARRDASSLRVSVRDEGIGMDAQELKSIFTKFYRTRKAEASGEAGTGIGLSLVHQIVAHHGGRMEVTSAPGEGSCFTMVLPRGILAAAPASTTAP